MFDGIDVFEYYDDDKLDFNLIGGFTSSGVTYTWIIYKSMILSGMSYSEQLV